MLKGCEGWLWIGCVRQLEMSGIMLRVDCCSLLVMEEGSNFRMIDGVEIYLWKNLFYHCFL